MATATKITDGIYFLHPEGSGWHAVQYCDGRAIDSTEEYLAGTHDAALDGWAGVYPSDGDEEMDAAASEQIVRDVLGDDVQADMVIVTRQVECE